MRIPSGKMGRLPVRRGKKGKFSNILPILCLMFIFWGCGDREETQVSTPEEELLKGWREYNLGNYASAILAFEKVLALVESSGKEKQLWIMSDAYNGLGWAYMNFSKSAGINRENLSISLGKFQSAIACNVDNSDAWVGRAGLLVIRRSSQSDIEESLKSIDNALQGNKGYLYRHDYDSPADLHALKAQCYYYLNEIDRAREEVNLSLAIEEDNDSALAIRGLL